MLPIGSINGKYTALRVLNAQPRNSHTLHIQ